MPDHHEISTQFFLNHVVFFSSHIMFIDTSTKEFTLVNIAISSHGTAIEHFLYYKMVANVYFLKQDIFHFDLSIVSFHASSKFSQ